MTRESYLREFVAPTKCTNLLDFLNHVPRSLDLLQTEHGLQVLVREMFRQMQADHMAYAELRFAPFLHTQKGLKPTDIVRTMEAATDQHAKDTGIEARLILCSLRHFSAEQSMETVALVDQFRGSRVAAFDLAGDEAGHPLSRHLEAFRYAKDKQIPITSHAGEGAGAQSVWETLRETGTQRLGHGVRSVEDPALVDYLREHKIHLEMCPTCNVQTDMFPTYADHVIDRLFRDDISLSISTENRTLTPITLTGEYEQMAKTFGWGKPEFLKANLYALDAAFLPPSVKESLRKRFIDAYAE